MLEETRTEPRFPFRDDIGASPRRVAAGDSATNILLGKKFPSA